MSAGVVMGYDACLKSLMVELNLLYKLGDTVCHAKQIYPIMQQLSALSGLSIPSAGIHQQSHENVDTLLTQFFEQVDVARLSTLSLITLLRTTFSQRELPAWKVLRDKAHQLLVEKELDAPKILRGLLD